MNFLRLLEQIGRAHARGARAINDAMYDEDPILRERKERIDLGPGLGESDVPTGDMETVGFGPKRPSKLNRVLGEAARGAIVAARNPTRGQIGTAGDIFGAMGAVEDDTRARSDRQMALSRQAEKDAMDRRIGEARAKDLEAQAEYNQWRTTQTKTGKANAPSQVEQYQAIYNHLAGLKRADGSPQIPPEQLHPETVSILNRQAHPAVYNVQNAKTLNAAQIAQQRKWSESPELQSQFPKFEDYWNSLGISTANASTIAEAATAKNKADLPFKRKQIINSSTGFKTFGLSPEGVPTNETVPITSEGKPTVPYVKPPAPQRPRIETPAQSRTAELNSTLSKIYDGDWKSTLEKVKSSQDPEVAKYRAQLVTAIENQMKKTAPKGTGKPSALADWLNGKTTPISSNNPYAPKK